MSSTHPFGEAAKNYRHGHKPACGASPEYIVWNGMRARCCNPKNPNYIKYGARGISVCDRWVNSFEAFLADMGRKPSPAHSIERLDNNGNYEPSNCCWATRKEQANNRRTSRFIEFAGENLTLAQWAEKTGLQLTTLHARLKSGWSVGDALRRPLRASVRKDQQSDGMHSRVYASPFDKFREK